jgi:Spy/CpxP family protein refolding chaperone
MRPLVTVLGFAAVTATATLAVCWPGSTYAEPPQMFGDQGEIDDVTFEGEVTHDAALRNGWGIKVTYQNRGDEEANCEIDAQLMRDQISPGSRSGPDGVAVWHHKEKVTVAAHESVVKMFDVPQWMAAQLTANEKATKMREKMIEREQNKPNGGNFALQMKPYVMYAVGFQKADG